MATRSSDDDEDHTLICDDQFLLFNNTDLLKQLNQEDLDDDDFNLLLEKEFKNEVDIPGEPSPPAIPVGRPKKIGEPKKMDVILNASRSSLALTGSPGNARFQILLGINSSKYENSYRNEKEAILQELYSTVESQWQGRFLTHATGCYQELPKEAALNAISVLLVNRRSFLSQTSAPVLEHQEYRLFERVESRVLIPKQAYYSSISQYINIIRESREE